MVDSIVHTAIARKMLCNPVNSLIADTEFATAAGMLLRILGAGEEEYKKAEEIPTTLGLFEWLFSEYGQQLEGEFDMPEKNLIQMLRNYRTDEKPLTMQLRRLLRLGYQEEIIYPKGRFT